MIVVDDMSIAAEALSCLAESAEVEIVRIKERFIREPTARLAGLYGERKVSEGSPHVWEVQIVHRELLVARRGLRDTRIYNCVRRGF